MITRGVEAMPFPASWLSWLLKALSTLFGADLEPLDEPAVLRLVEQARAGDRAARQRLYRQHVNRVYRTVRGLLRSDAEAEDVTQDAMLMALTSLQRYSPRSGTAAARCSDDVTPEEKQRRLAILLELQRKIAHEVNQGWVGRTVEVLIEGKDEKRGNVLARTPQNKIVVLPPDEHAPGTFRRATIARAEGQTLFGALEPAA